MASHKNDPQKGADVNEERRYVIHIMTARFIFISRKNADCRRKSSFNFKVLFSVNTFFACFLLNKYLQNESVYFI